MPRFHETTFGVYFDDLDLFGVLHNSRYLLFFERAIGELWARIGRPGLSGVMSPDQAHLVRTNHIEYLRPVEGMGEVRVRVSVKKLGRTSIVFGFRLMPMDEDVELAVGERVLVRIDPETRRPSPWSDDFRERIAPFVQP